VKIKFEQKKNLLPTRIKAMEENSKTFLEPILWLLKVLKFFGGLPLDITFTDGRTKIKFSWWQGIKMVFLLFIVAITMIAPQFYELLCSLFSGQVYTSIHHFEVF